LAPGEIICRQGEPADSFFLVRLGFVKVAQQFAGGEVVLATRGAAASSRDRSAHRRAADGNCSAVDHVEVVRIGADDFRLMLERFPGVAVGLEAEPCDEEIVTARSALCRRRSMSRSFSPKG